MNSISFICPKNNIPERIYSIKVLFDELLGCEIPQDSIQFDNSVKDYVICYGENRIVIEDHFFLEHPENLSYLDKKNLPKSLDYFHGFGLEIPIIYGRDKIEEKDSPIDKGIDTFNFLVERRIKLYE